MHSVIFLLGAAFAVVPEPECISMDGGQVPVSSYASVTSRIEFAEDATVPAEG